MSCIVEEFSKQLEEAAKTYKGTPMGAKVARVLGEVKSINDDTVLYSMAEKVEGKLPAKYYRELNKLVREVLGPKVTTSNTLALSKATLGNLGVVAGNYEKGVITISKTPSADAYEAKAKGVFEEWFSTESPYASRFNGMNDEEFVIKLQKDEDFIRLVPEGTAKLKAQLVTDFANVKGSHTFAHEMVHAGAFEFMQANPEHKLTKRIEELYKLALDNEKEISASIGKDASTYWTTNINEFLAEGLTNPEVVKAFKKIKTGSLNKYSTLFSDMIDTLMKMLGFTVGDDIYSYLLDGYSAMVRSQAYPTMAEAKRNDSVLSGLEELVEKREGTKYNYAKAKNSYTSYLADTKQATELTKILEKYNRDVGTTKTVDLSSNFRYADLNGISVKDLEKMVAFNKAMLDSGKFELNVGASTSTFSISVDGSVLIDLEAFDNTVEEISVLHHELVHAATYSKIAVEMSDAEIKAMVTKFMPVARKVFKNPHKYSRSFTDRLQYVLSQENDQDKLAEMFAIIASEPAFRTEVYGVLAAEERNVFKKILAYVRRIFNADYGIIKEVLDTVDEAKKKYLSGNTEKVTGTKASFGISGEAVSDEVKDVDSAQFGSIIKTSEGFFIFKRVFDTTRAEVIDVKGNTRYINLNGIGVVGQLPTTTYNKVTYIYDYKSDRLFSHTGGEKYENKGSPQRKQIIAQMAIPSPIKQPNHSGKHETTANFETVKSTSPKDTTLPGISFKSIDITKLNSEQAILAEELVEFLNSDDKEFTINAPGGSGKTYTLGQVFGSLPSSVIQKFKYVAPTNTAAHVLAQAFDNDVKTSTLAKLIRKGPDKKTLDSFVILSDKSKFSADSIIVVDEASMVSNDDYDYLYSRLSPQNKVIYVGDAAQLPPIEALDKASTVFERKKGRRHGTLSSIVRFSETSGIGNIAAALRDNALAKNPKNPVHVITSLPLNDKNVVSLPSTQENSEEVAYSSFLKDYNKNPYSTTFITYNNEESNIVWSVKHINSRIRNILFPKNPELLRKNDVLIVYAATTVNTDEKIDMNNNKSSVPEATKRVYNIGETIDIRSVTPITQHTVSVDTDRGRILVEGLEVQIVTTKNDEVIPVFTKNGYKKSQETLVTLFDIAKKGERTGTATNKRDWFNYFKYKEAISQVMYAHFNYAITSHKAQGRTIDTAYVVLDNIVDNRSTPFVKATSSYVAMSRAKKKLVIISDAVATYKQKTDTIPVDKPIKEMTPQELIEKALECGKGK